MRISDPRPFMDAMLESQDEIEVELVNAISGRNAKVLYVHVNGVSVLRIGGIIKDVKGIIPIIPPLPEHE